MNYIMMNHVPSNLSMGMPTLISDRGHVRYGFIFLIVQGYAVNCHFTRTIRDNFRQNINSILILVIDNRILKEYRI